MKYIRVEAYNRQEEVIIGGRSHVSFILLQQIQLTVPRPYQTEIERRIGLVVSEWASLKVADMLNILCIIPKPSEAFEDIANHYCLYSLSGFNEAEIEIKRLSKELKKKTGGRYCLVAIEYDLSPTELLYSDSKQALISDETYEKYMNEALVMHLE